MSMELVLMEQRDKARQEVDRITLERDRALSMLVDFQQLKEEREIGKREFARLHKRFCELNHEHEQITEELDTARAEVERLKRQSVNAVTLSWSGPRLSGGGGGGGPCAGNDHHIPDATKMARAEPSRLEIAAMLLAGWVSNPDALPQNNFYHWLQEADKLIAAASEGGAK